MEVPAGLPMQAEGTGRFGTGTSGALFVCRALQTEGDATVQPVGRLQGDGPENAAGITRLYLFRNPSYYMLYYNRKGASGWPEWK